MQESVVWDLLLNFYLFFVSVAGESDSEGIDNEIDPFSTTTKEANIKSEPISPCASTSIVQVHIPIHGGSSFSHQNFPIVCSKFTDPDTEREKVLMVASMPGGSENIRIEISEDGRMVTVRYAWTRSMCDIRELFRHQLMKKDFTTYHPMVLSFKAQLLKAKSSIEAAPDAAIQVRLPIQIQKSLGSYQTWEIRQNDGSSVLMAEFTGLAGHTNEISYNIHQS